MVAKFAYLLLAILKFPIYGNTSCSVAASCGPRCQNISYNHPPALGDIVRKSSLDHLHPQCREHVELVGFFLFRLYGRSFANVVVVIVVRDVVNAALGNNVILFLGA